MKNEQTEIISSFSPDVMKNLEAVQRRVENKSEEG
jgi:hypothetical protein